MIQLLGSIDRLPSGRYRYRVTDQHRTVSRIFGTEQEATALQLTVSRAAADPNAETLRTYGETFLEWRETKQKVRDIKSDKSRWHKHVEPAAIASMPLRELRPVHVEAWAEKLLGSAQTRRHALNLLRRCLARAKRERIIGENPAIGVRIEGSDPDAWSYLSPPEQLLITTSPLIPEHDRCAIAFAIGTGLRQGEQWALQLIDVHVKGPDPHVVVRWGSKGKPTKTGRVRTVPLFGLALQAARRMLELLPGYLRSQSGKKMYKNEHGLLFPACRGGYRRGKKPPRGWSAWLLKLGIRGMTGQQVVWHSLRHTCATNLVSGAWGRRWTLQEVAELLGHESVETTERYAHMAEGTLTRAARETVVLSRRCHGRSKSSRATVDSNHWPSAPEANHEAEQHSEVAGEMTTAVTRLAVEFLQRVEAGDPRAIATAIRLAERVLTEAGVDGVEEEEGRAGQHLLDDAKAG